ncbi:MAG TPA: hypothetical protein VFP58_12455, partial [Candidatus Eisenbacteria bacterium]|nr:hypothetical protein [Candidatus Eisenbacteria bacterium]
MRASFRGRSALAALLLSLSLAAPAAAPAATVVLRWTAPGDDGMAGLASQYRIAYSESPASGNM